MGEVRSLRGNHPVRHPGNPDPSVVKALEDVLEMARSGEITGVAMTYAFFDGAPGLQWSGLVSWGMVGRLADLNQRMIEKLQRD